jgi:hypothetical protein
MVSTGQCSSAARTSSGTSSRSTTFQRGSTTRERPARWAARTFSLTPPTGSTRPRRVISPVMARSLRTIRPDTADASATTMVTPADGPSLGIAPDGTCTWTSWSLNATSRPPSQSARDRTRDSAVCADSRMTSPRDPVSVSRPEPPGISAAST